MQVLKLLKSEVIAVNQKTAYVMQLKLVRSYGMEIAVIFNNGQFICSFNEPRYAYRKFDQLVKRYSKQ